MKKLPEIKNSWADFYNLMRVRIQGNILIQAIEWKIFDCLTTSVSAKTVAEKLKFDTRNTELFLNALAGMDIIVKQNGLYSNTDKSSEFLLSTSPTYLGSFLLHVNQWHEQLSPNIETLVEKGPPENSGINMMQDSMWAESARLSAAYQYSGEAQHIAHIISELPEFPGMKKMLDLGGGAGFFTMAIVSAHPNLKGVIFEQPSVAAVAREFIMEYQMEDRMDVITGDYTRDSFGDGYDLVFASSTLNFVKHNLDDFFKKIYHSLRDGGIFITHQDGITHERTKPVNHITEFLSAELYGMDFAISQGKIAEAMLQAGFKSVRSFTRHSDAGDMDVDIGRK